jgi:hypothetical protein
MFSLLVGWWSRGVRTAAAKATRGADLQIAAAVHKCSSSTTLLLVDITCIPSSRHGVSVSWAIGPRERGARELENIRHASREEPAPADMRQTLLVNMTSETARGKGVCVDCSNGPVEVYSSHWHRLCLGVRERVGCVSVCQIRLGHAIIFRVPPYIGRSGTAAVVQGLVLSSRCLVTPTTCSSIPSTTIHYLLLYLSPLPSNVA